MNRIKSIFTPAFFVRVAVIVLIILLAVFLYHYGKQHTVYVDNRMIKKVGEVMKTVKDVVPYA